LHNARNEKQAENQCDGMRIEALVDFAWLAGLGRWSDAAKSWQKKSRLCADLARHLLS